MNINDPAGKPGLTEPAGRPEPSRAANLSPNLTKLILNLVGLGLSSKCGIYLALLAQFAKELIRFFEFITMNDGCRRRFAAGWPAGREPLNWFQIKLKLMDLEPAAGSSSGGPLVLIKIFRRQLQIELFSELSAVRPALAPAVITGSFKIRC